MRVADEVAIDLEAHLKAGRVDEAALGAARLRTLDPQRWHRMLNDGALNPLVSISDSVLQNVTIVLELHAAIEAGTASGSEEDIAQAIADLTRLKQAFEAVREQMAAADRWLSMTATERWLHRLLEAAQGDDEERQRLADMLATQALRNAKKRERLAELEAEFASLRAEARQALEARWSARRPATPSLNAQQQAAAEHAEGRLVITAGPGSGKTHVLVERMARLVEAGCPPERILMLTFTVKATAEMERRVAQRLEGITTGVPHVINFNSFCKECVDLDPDGFGFDRSPVHVAPGLRPFLIDDLLELNLDDDIREALKRPFVRALTTAMDDLLHNRAAEPLPLAQRFLEEVLTPAEEVEAADIAAGKDPSRELVRARDVHLALRAVVPMRTHIRSQGGLTFGDQITLVHRRLLDEASYAEAIGERFDHLLVDEFQDNNLAQGEIVHRLSDLMTSTCVVGDADQAIYQFRGANVRNIHDFLERFDGEDLTRVDLDVGYRHSQALIDLSEALIALHPGRIDRPHVTTGWVNDDHTAIEAFRYLDTASETVETVEWMRRQHLLGYEWDEMAVLARSLAHVEVLQQHLDQRGVPYVTTSSETLFRDPSTRFAGLLLRSCLDPVRQGHALQMLLYEGAFGVLREDATVLGAQARGAQHLHSTLVNRRGRYQHASALDDASRFLEEHRLLDEDLSGWMFRTLRDAGVVEVMLSEGPDHPMSRLLNHLTMEIEAAGRLLTNQARFARLLEQMMSGGRELDVKQVQRPGHVLISTVHQAKGLEWELVVMPCMDAKNSPPIDNLERAKTLVLTSMFDEDPELEVDNERLRVLYVGGTRAVDVLRLSMSLSDGGGKPRSPNALLDAASRMFGVEQVTVQHPSIARHALSDHERAVVGLRQALDDRLRDLAHGNEAQDIKASLRGMMAFQLERMALDGRSMTPELRDLIDAVEAVAGSISLRPTDAPLQHLNGLGAVAPVVERYSWSMIKDFAACPQRFRFKYVHSIKTPSSKAATTGIVVHDALEHLAQQEHVDEDAINAAFDAAMLKRGHMLPLLDQREEDEARAAVHAWMASEAAGHDVIAVEATVSFTFEGRPFTGKIDRVDRDADGRLRLVDFKTGKHRKYKPGSRGNEQLLLYAFGWNQMHDRSPDHLVLDYVMSGEPPVVAEVDPIMLERGLARLVPLLDGIDHGPWDATPDAFVACKYCDYRSLCPDVAT